MDRRLKNKIIGHTIDAGIKTGLYSAMAEILHYFGVFDDRTYAYGIGLPAFLALPYAKKGVKNLKDKMLEAKIIQGYDNNDLADFIAKYLPEMPSKDASYGEKSDFEKRIESMITSPEKLRKELCLPESKSKQSLFITMPVDLEKTVSSLCASLEENKWPTSVETDIFYDWTPSGILMEERFTVPLKIHYTWKTVEPKPIVSGNSKTNMISINVTDKRIEVDGSGDGIGYMGDIAKILNPNMVHLELTEKDLNLIQSYNIPGLAKEVFLAALISGEDVEKYRNVKGFSRILGLDSGEEENLLPLTAKGLVLLEREMRTNLIESSKLERMIRLYKKEDPLKVNDLKKIILYLQAKEKELNTEHPIITLPWAKQLLLEELDSIEKIFEGPESGKPMKMMGRYLIHSLHVPARNNLRQLCREFFGEEFNEESFNDGYEYMGYLKSMGYRVPEEWLKQDVERLEKLKDIKEQIGIQRELRKDEIYKDNEYFELLGQEHKLSNGTSYETHVIQFLRQILAEEPDRLIIPYRESFKHKQPEWHITGKLEGTAQDVIKSNKPEHAKIRRLRIEQNNILDGYGWKHSTGNIIVQESNNGPEAEFYISFEPKHVLHGIQNVLLQELGIKLNF